jgi:hypothetical protein
MRFDDLMVDLCSSPHPGADFKKGTDYADVIKLEKLTVAVWEVVQTLGAGRHLETLCGAA